MKTIVRILTVFVFFSSAYADERQSVLKAISPFAEIEQRNFLEGADVGQTPEDYFRIFFAKRLSWVSPEEQSFLKTKLNAVEHQVEDRMAEIKILVSASGDINSRIPRAFLNSLLYFSALIHELEHCLQLLRSKYILNDTRRLEHLLGDAEVVFLMEKDAMSIEWLFLHLAPRHLIEENLSSLSQLGLSRLEESAYSRMLSESELSLESYLDSQWAGGRSNERTAWIVADRNRELLARQDRLEKSQQAIEKIYRMVNAEKADRSNSCPIVLTLNNMDGPAESW